MGSILVSKLLGEVSKDVFDNQSTRRYTEEVLLEFLADGELTVVSLKPSEYVARGVHQLMPGSYQVLPYQFNLLLPFMTPATAGVVSVERLIRPIRNMGADGETPGPGIQIVQHDHFDRINPGWMDATADTVVQLIILDEQNECGFFCYPPQPDTGTHYMQTLCAIAPPVYQNYDTDVIRLRDSMYTTLYFYVMHRVWKRMHSPIAASESAKYWNQFVLTLDRKDLLDKEYSPNRDRKKEQHNAN